MDVDARPWFGTCIHGFRTPFLSVHPPACICICVGVSGVYDRRELALMDGWISERANEWQNLYRIECIAELA